ncbi:Gimap6 [Symbiodinium necroappetens]|uniref:Gimap6 protein n=1 Tax=Symbiodinium necroappetens TaxID=1628268 RepID=A0A812X8S6_9DINO|nr:Gimap6 [Symbiodinium necroappetens]
MDPAADSAIGQATISKAFVLGIAEYARWGRLPGAGADAKEASNFLDDMGRREDTTVLSGEVTQESLCQELTTWVRDILKATDGHERPALIGFFSCHSMMNANGWPPCLHPMPHGKSMFLDCSLTLKNS